MIGYKDIAKTASALDARADGEEALLGMLTEMNVDQEGAMQATLQRVYRAKLHAEGKPVPNRPVPMDLGDRDNLALLGACWLDGFVIGLHLSHQTMVQEFGGDNSIKRRGK